MAGEREIKGRIKSVKNIQQITKAMKMVAAARIKKVETRMKASRPFAYKMQEVVGELTSQMEGALHPLMETRPTRNIALMVVSADKGLCGSYNNNLLKIANQFVQNHSNLQMIPVGSKATRFFTKRGARFVGEPFVNWNPEMDLARQLAEKISEMFISGQVDEVHCAYTRVVSALSQEAKVERILPLQSTATQSHPLPYLFEPSPEVALQTILPRYLEIIMYQMLLEARTAELGARLRAMTSATDNAHKLVGDLTLEYFRARQASITNEILEVAGGAEALKK